MTFPQETVDLAHGRMPLLGFGTWQIKGSRASDSVGWALDAGYRHLDTATVYGNEKEVGAGLAASGVPRDDVFVTTKCPPNAAGKELATLRTSLDLLGTDRVDLWLIHWAAWRGRRRRDLAGVRRGPGTGTGARHRGEQLLARADRRADPRDRRDPRGEPGGVEPAALRPRGARRSPGARRGPRGLQRAARRHPRAPGHRRDRRATRPQPAQVIIRWHLQHRIVVIPKSVQEQRIRSNADVDDFTLSDDDMAALDALGNG